MSPPLPINLQGDDLTMYLDYQKIEYPEIEIRELGSVAISADGQIYKGFHRMPENSPHYFVQDRQAYADYRALSTKRKIKNLIKHFLLHHKVVHPEGCIVFNYFSKDYYHWICETLPKISYVETHFPTKKIFLPAFYKKYRFVEESMTLFPTLDFVFLPPETTAMIRQALWISPMGEPYLYNPDFFGAFIRSLQAKLPPSTYSFPRIFIDRERANKRKLINRSEVIAVLKRFGYETIQLEDYALLDQIKLFKSADLVVGLHGAGLSNLVFNPNIKGVLELQKKMHFCSCYYGLCRALHIPYATQYTVPEYDTSPTEQTCDLFIDPDLLSENLAQLETLL